MHIPVERFLTLLGAASLLATQCAGQTFTPFLPPSYPLAVRNPYLQAWLPGSLAKDLPTAVPQFWTGTNDLHWSVQARVDGDVYDLLGVPDPDGSTAATYHGGSFTATHTIFSLTAGGVDIELDFFSPVSVNNLLRQSLPFSYLTVKVSGANGKEIQILSSIDDTWTAQTNNTNHNQVAQDGVTMFTMTNANAVPFSELSDMAGWGTAVFAGIAQRGATLSSGLASQSQQRSQFAKTGTLSNATTDEYVVGLSYDLGSVTADTEVQFVVGYVRQRAINYLGTSRTHYYRSQYPKTIDALVHFFDDYSDALSEASDLDSTIDSKATEIGGQNYSEILTLSTRQITGGTDVTIPGDSLDPDDIYIFIKEISSNGNLNTVDIIFPTFPFYYIFSPVWIKYLLQPMIDYLEGGTYPEDYVIHDMGSHYPNSTGHDNSKEEKMPVEETGNLLMLVQAYQSRTGDASYRDAHRSLLDGYAQYLIENGEFPAHQLSTNDGIGAFTNMTNLGVKAAVGLDAYALVTGNETYSKIAKSFADTIYTDGVGVRISNVTGETYFTLTYQDPTWFMLFNLYPQKLFGMDTFPEAAFKGQSDLYPTVRGSYGVTLEGAIDWAKTDWQMWCAAVAEDSTKEIMVNDLHAYVSNGQNVQPFSDRYYSRGEFAGLVGDANFRDRPTLGAHFALWALEVGATE